MRPSLLTTIPCLAAGAADLLQLFLLFQVCVLMWKACVPDSSHSHPSLLLGRVVSASHFLHFFLFFPPFFPLAFCYILLTAHLMPRFSAVPTTEC